MFGLLGDLLRLGVGSRRLRGGWYETVSFIQVSIGILILKGHQWFMPQRFVLINICGEQGYQNHSRGLQWNLDPKGPEQPFPKTRWVCCFPNPSHHSICETQGGLDYRQAGHEFLAFGHAYELFTA